MSKSSRAQDSTNAWNKLNAHAVMDSDIKPQDTKALKSLKQQYKSYISGQGGMQAYKSEIIDIKQQVEAKGYTWRQFLDM